MSLLGRRAFLKVATGVWPMLALAGVRRKFRGVVWIWVDGGMCPGHTWDPKPITAIGCQAKSIPTSVPGIQVSELLPVCASQMKHLTLIRSFSHGFGALDVGTKVMHVGDTNVSKTDSEPIGTILAHELGADDFPLPKYVSIGGPSGPGRSVFGLDCLPFHVNANDMTDPIPHLRRKIDVARDRERAELLYEQNKDWDARRLQPQIEELESAYLRSGALMDTPLLKAFNIFDEPATLRAEYGEGFGPQCLLARRLVESGCPFVEVGLQSWGPMFCNSDRYRQRMNTLDQGLGTLVKDLAQKELLADMLVVCVSPFGRFARASEGGFQSHVYSVVLAGGCLRRGMVYGDTGSSGMNGKPPVSVKDLFATILKACGVDGGKEYQAEARRKKTYASGGKPIEELF